MITLIVWLSTLMVGVILTAALYVAYPMIEDAYLSRLNVYTQSLYTLCDRMFIETSQKTLAIVVLTSTFLMAIVGFYLTFGFGVVNVMFTLGLGYFGFLAPKLILTWMLEKRIETFNEQLIDALTLLSNSLKSGLNLSQALQILVREMSNPISQEFAVVLSQEKIGLTLDDALEKMADRIPSEDLSVMVQAILILRETGGNLSETFDVIAGTIRDRRRVDGKIKSMTAQGKMQGLILFILPFAFLFVLYTINPPYIAPLFTTQLGWIFIGIMLFFQTLGGLWIRKIIKIEV